jgi:hypothetical protein
MSFGFPRDICFSWACLCLRLLVCSPLTFGVAQKRLQIPLPARIIQPTVNITDTSKRNSFSRNAGVVLPGARLQGHETREKIHPAACGLKVRFLSKIDMFARQPTLIDFCQTGTVSS